MSPLCANDARIAAIVADAEANLSEADSLYACAGMLEAAAMLSDLFDRALSDERRAQAAKLRETAKALAHSATARQFEASRMKEGIA